jgi:hypothetical protein
MESKAFRFGSIGSERVRRVFPMIGIIDLLMSSSACPKCSQVEQAGFQEACMARKRQKDRAFAFRKKMAESYFGISTFSKYRRAGCCSYNRR